MLAFVDILFVMWSELSDITDETDEVCKVLYIEDKSDNILLVKRILGRRV